MFGGVKSAATCVVCIDPQTQIVRVPNIQRIIGTEKNIGVGVHRPFAALACKESVSNLVEWPAMSKPFA